MLKASWHQVLVVLVIILVLAVNLVLLEKKGSKVERLNFISSWEEVKAGDLVKTLRTEGVVAPSERHPVFVDPNVTFKEFLVEKGERVENGTPLFEYATEDLDEQIALLDAEIARLEKEKKSIETFVSDMERTKSALPRQRSNVQPVFGGDPESDAVSETMVKVEAARQVREDAAEIRAVDRLVSERELDLEKVDLEIQKYEEQRDLVESGRSGLTILSSVDGIVEDISFELNNPVITIVSEDLFVEGQLNEQEVATVEEGMRVDVHSDLFVGELTGEIGSVSELPLEQATVERASFYPFNVILDVDEAVDEDDDVGEDDDGEEVDDGVGENVDDDVDDDISENADVDVDENADVELYAGYHVLADIVLDEALEVPVVQRESIRGHSYLWVLGRSGIVEKRKVELGLQVGKQAEILGGAELGELFVVQENEIDHAAPFITPFKGNKSIFNQWESESFRRKLKYVLVGILQR
ncbi:efflux RND transporter periplasmic adaptor subunit [Lederbergia panacisoli]|uniref:efflux RND transporter periplasmic adaptor subunit n=1 Tax=Lederbergia panacisoli TaxID=1255251 RepID=UPI00214B2D0B|nr:HlyD family efflux transporter periplasmic adaptor subunit [Lederbergia panacisoli]MCR2821408.1 HlyD family efflux transporter periplasmic adaptor subunit [Lederbergia panacisoli]